MAATDNATSVSFADTPHIIDWDSLKRRSLTPGGFGDERVSIWPRLLNAAPISAGESSVTYPIQDEGSDEGASASLEESVSSHRDERQIGLDTERSFVLYPVDATTERTQLQVELHRLIVEVFRKRPQLSYFQGYHDVISVLYLTLPRELRLTCAEKISLHRLRDSMGTSLEPVVGLLRILKRIIAVADPEYAKLLEETSPLPYHALSNLLTLFSHDVPTLSLIQHIFDYLLCRPPIAVVYLAAALVLSRKAEATEFEREGEEGMIHSLLSSLPNLYEEDGEPLAEVPDEPEAELSRKVFAAKKAVSGDDAFVVEVDEAAEEDVDAEIAISDARTSDASTESNEESALQEGPVANVEKPVQTSDEDITIPLDYIETESQKSVAAEESISEKRSSASTFSTRRPKVSLSSLLRRADELYSEIPPSHPAISLSTIMGPQSVMLTWSENFDDLPSDDEAERMVLKPELIVLPYIDPEDAVDSGSESSHGGSHREKDKRKRRKLRKPRRLDSLVRRRTVVASAVLVLGVAVAIYGMQAGGQGGTFDGSHRHGAHRDLKRVSGLIGGIIVGFGERIVDSIWR